MWQNIFKKYKIKDSYANTHFIQKPGLISHSKMHPGSQPPLPRVCIDHIITEVIREKEEMQQSGLGIMEN